MTVDPSLTQDEQLIATTAQVSTDRSLPLTAERQARILVITVGLVPGAIVMVTGLILAAQNATGDWASWAYAWTLVLPGGAGLGLFLQGLRVHDPKQLRLGRNLMFWSALMFMIGFVIFESIFNISGQDFGIVSRAALPVLLIIIGVTLLARSVQRGRSA